MTLILIILIILIPAIIAGVVLLRKRKGSSGTTAAQNMQAIINSLIVQTADTDMPFVLSQKPLTDVLRRGIKEAFRERTEKAKTLGWTQGFDPTQYRLMIFPSVRDTNSDGVYSPSFQVFFDAGDAYDESIYDQVKGTPGGWTYAAEQVLTDNGNLTDIFIIADNTSYEYTVTATSNGLDHLYLWKNDRAEYERTKSHVSGINHPLW